MSLADASQAVTDNISSFKLEASDATKIADMMAFAQANSSTTAAELAQSYKNCAANMSAAGQEYRRPPHPCWNPWPITACVEVRQVQR